MNAKKQKDKFVVFGAGVPTEPDVNEIMRLTAPLNEGDLIEYALIERACGEPRDTHRARSVIAQLKKRVLRERNWLLVARINEGYEIADPSKRVVYSVGQVHGAKRRILKSAAIAATTDAEKLTEEQRRLRDHIRDLPGRLRLAELTAPKRVEAPKEIKKD